MAFLMNVETGSIERESFFRKIDIYDSWGTNFVDFKFTYDTYNTCMNNFRIYNNQYTHTSMKFTIYMNNEIKYNGWASIPPRESIYFNNAFWDCDSSADSIKIFTD